MNEILAPMVCMSLTGLVGFILGRAWSSTKHLDELIEANLATIHALKAALHWRHNHDHQVRLKRRLGRALQALKEHHRIPGADIDLAMRIPEGKRLPDEWCQPKETPP